MKKYLITTTLAIIAVPMLALADVCSDVATQYNSFLLAMESQMNAALSQTTDPAEVTGIREAYDMQKAQIVAERDATLASLGCGATTTTDPGTTPPTDPGTTPPTDPGTTPPTDPGTTPPGTTPPPVTGPSCEELKTLVLNTVKSMRENHARQSDIVHYANSQKALIQSTCDKPNTWGHDVRREIGGNKECTRQETENRERERCERHDDHNRSNNGRSNNNRRGCR